MKLPHTVTLFQPSGRTVLSGVLLESTRGTSVSKTAMNSADTVTLHIPFSVAPDLRLDPETDYFAYGDVPDEGSYQANREKHEVYRVTSVARYDYGSPQMQHWEVGGK